MRYVAIPHDRKQIVSIVTVFVVMAALLAALFVLSIRAS